MQQTKRKFGDTLVNQGSGGETRQQAEGKIPVLTTQTGVPVSDNQNSLKIGARGPTLLEDQILRDKIFHFDHERIPERIVHARGYGAHGYFQNYKSLSDITTADLFQREGEKTPVFVRFSTVAGNKGSADMVRDVRGFATKFYTKEGNWDLVGNNIPVFFIQDAMKFPDLIHAAKQEPDRDFPQAATAHDNFWDFISLMPESTHMIMWAMSDRAIPRSFRFMEGFGVHTFRFINSKGASTFVKFHWKPVLGMQSIVWNEALKINGADPDFHRRDLWENIEAGNYPEWELGLQLFDEEFANKFEFDVLDSTKLIPEELVPVKRVGKLVLDKMPENFFRETEQVAYCTQNIVPGIDFTNDPLLQGRNFSYLDTQLLRLGGPNFNQLPINAPKGHCPFAFFHQDGHMNLYGPKGRVNYEPNSWGDKVPNPRETSSGYKSYQEQVSGTKQRVRSESFADHYSQARQFYISQTDVEQIHIQDALVFELSKVEREDIRKRVVSHLLNVDQDLAKKVISGLGLQKTSEGVSEIPKATPAKPPNTDLPPSDALSIIKNGPKNIKGRKFGFLLTDGANSGLFKTLTKAVEDAGASYEVICPVVGGVELSDGKHISGHRKIDGGPSVVFDFVVILTSSKGIAKLVQLPPSRDFVADAFAHYKYIAYSPETAPLLKKAGIAEELDEGCFELKGDPDVSSFIMKCGNLRFWDRERKMKGNE